MEQTLWRTFQNDNFSLWGVNFAESQEDIEGFVDNLGLTFPILLDSNGMVYQQYVIEFCQSPFPQDYIIDQDGLIAYKACEYFPDSMVAVVEELLGTTDVPRPELPAAGGVRIDMVWPNPASGDARIVYVLPENGIARVDILDGAGRRIRTLDYGRMESGPQLAVWDRRDARGRSVSAGTYFARVTSAGQVTTRKISILR